MLRNDKYKDLKSEDQGFAYALKQPLEIKFQRFLWYLFPALFCISNRATAQGCSYIGYLGPLLFLSWSEKSHTSKTEKLLGVRIRSCMSFRSIFVLETKPLTLIMLRQIISEQHRTVTKLNGSLS